MKLASIVIQIPRVTAQNKRPKRTPVSRDKIEIIRVRAKIPFVVRKIKQRNTLRVEHCIPRLHLFARSDFYPARADHDRWILHVIRRDDGIRRIIGPLLHPIGNILP